MKSQQEQLANKNNTTYVYIGQKATGITPGVFGDKSFVGKIVGLSADGYHVLIEDKWGLQKSFFMSKVFLGDIK